MADYLAAALRAGRRVNGVTEVRMMRDTFAEAGPRVVHAMGEIRFIWLRRGDLAAQAASQH